MELGELLLLLLLSEPLPELFIESLEPEVPLVELLPPLDPADVPELAPVPDPEPALPLLPPLWAKTGAQMPSVPSAAMSAVRRVNLFFECNGDGEFMACNLAQVRAPKNGARR